MPSINSKKTYSSFKILTMVCVLISVGLFAYIFIHLLQLEQPILKDDLPEYPGRNRPIIDNRVEPAGPRPFEDYEKILGERVIFKNPVAREVFHPEQDTVQQPKINFSSDFKARYKIVGILLGEKPLAVVEDNKKNETLFLNQGDKLEGVDVLEILEHKIIFGLEKQRIELEP